ncbi:hypothetical protein BDZ94DRAFT_102837 [Collybia nuda]|uniref:Thioesterase domain-containing protein n=1 Tax=Collybia nuda TaxID=64659 RepID=A0A9P5XX99_9AGAR|nr:hypothetical protein BDZ94DRAFT_102837 [Collybia nuda]
MVQSLRSFLETRLEDEVVSLVSGNAPREIKEIPIKWLTIFRNRKISFANSIADRIKVVEVSIVENPEDPFKIDGRVVCEIDVTSDMLNATGAMHEGCAVFLIDECSACSLAVLNAAEGRPSRPGVSQAINTIFHSQARLGTRLRIVNTSMTGGVEMTSCKAEIWDIQNHRLIASGVQLQMMPSRPRKL